MKNKLAALLALLMLTFSLNAGGIGFGISFGFGCPQVVYTQPVVVYTPPPPQVVYVAPQPQVVYVSPQPVVYVQTAPVIVAPRPVVYQSYWHNYHHHRR